LPLARRQDRQELHARARASDHARASAPAGARDAAAEVARRRFPAAPGRRRDRGQPACAKRRAARRRETRLAMARVNLLLLAALAACALGLVTSQHLARRYFGELEQEQERSRQLGVEYGQLQLEASTWAVHARVERIAGRQLHMRVPDAKHLYIARPEEAAKWNSPPAPFSRS